MSPICGQQSPSGQYYQMIADGWATDAAVITEYCNYSALRYRTLDEGFVYNLDGPGGWDDPHAACERQVLQ
ncbi:MAG: hypothetical protein Q9212_001128 [Teloschistes hypoglaucus]